VQTPNPQKSGVPRVPCVPKLLKAFKFMVFNGGTQNALNWNTWAMAHKRCSEISKDGGSPPLSDGLKAMSGVIARIFTGAEMGRGVNVE
jgi:hypothetical protein